MTKTNNTTTTDRPQVWELTPEEELTLCEIIRFIDLRAMHQSNGTDQAINDLIRGCYLDTLWSATATKQSRATDLRATATAERAIANQARKLLNRVRVTDEERTEAYRIMTEYSTLASNDREEAEDIEKDNSTLTASLAQDMLHTIWIELQAIKADPDRQTPEAFGELCKAGRAFIQSLTAVTAIDSTNTISRPLSKAEAVDLMTRYNIDPKARPRNRWTQTAKGCTGYYTLEAKERKRDIDPEKVDPATIASYIHYNEACIWYYENITIQTTHSGHRTAYPALDAKAYALRYWHRLTPAQKAQDLNLDPANNPVLYLVLHIPTIRKQTAIEELTDHDPRTAEQISASTIADIDPVKLAELAKLSHQARTAVEALTHPQAIEQAKRARAEAIAKGATALEKLQADRAKAGKKPYRPGKLKQMQDQYKTTAENAYSATLWEYALTVAGYTKTAQAKAKSTITAKLCQALKTAPDSATPGIIDYRKLMQQTHRGNPTAPGKAVDLIKWTEGQTTTKTPQAIQWTESNTAPESIAPGKDYRAEEVFTRDSYRAIAPKATPPERTPREQAQWERLCRRECELADLWREYNNRYGAIAEPPKTTARA